MPDRNQRRRHAALFLEQQIVGRHRVSRRHGIVHEAGGGERLAHRLRRPRHLMAHANDENVNGLTLLQRGGEIINRQRKRVGVPRIDARGQRQDGAPMRHARESEATFFASRGVPNRRRTGVAMKKEE
jgi:hypothetical protein